MLADAVYSGVVASDFGFRQNIRIGPMSGRSNVIFWLEENGVEPTDERIDRVFAAAKKSDRLLEDGEIKELLAAAAEVRASPRDPTKSPSPILSCARS